MSVRAPIIVIPGPRIARAAAALVTNGLLHYVESDSFDAAPDGAVVNTWNDKSGNGRNWGFLTTMPTVDGTRLAGGHKTVRFSGGNCRMQQTKFMAAGYAGIEVMVVLKLDADPPATGSSRIFVFNCTGGSGIAEQPYTDGNWYECFGRTDRPSLGNPTTSAAAGFCVYNLASKADGTAYDAWINSENFNHATSGYTFAYTSGESSYFLGDTQSASLGILGNVAGVYLWNHYLTSAERSSQRGYINAKFGTTA